MSKSTIGSSDFNDEFKIFKASGRHYFPQTNIYYTNINSQPGCTVVNLMVITEREICENTKYYQLKLSVILNFTAMKEYINLRWGDKDLLRPKTERELDTLRRKIKVFCQEMYCRHQINGWTFKYVGP